VDPVDVLGRVDRIDDRAQPDRPRQWHLDDDAVDGRIVVEPPNGRRDVRLGCLALELDETAVDPDLVAAPQDPLEMRSMARLPDDDARAGARPACGNADVLGDGGRIPPRSPRLGSRALPGPSRDHARRQDRSRFTPTASVTGQPLDLAEPPRRQTRRDPSRSTGG
jgi:hypothetical protein